MDQRGLEWRNFQNLDELYILMAKHLKIQMRKEWLEITMTYKMETNIGFLELRKTELTDIGQVEEK